MKIRFGRFEAAGPFFFQGLSKGIPKKGLEPGPLPFSPIFRAGFWRTGAFSRGRSGRVICEAYIGGPIRVRTAPESFPVRFSSG